jgi:hypothetical protein
MLNQVKMNIVGTFLTDSHASSAVSSLCLNDHLSVSEMLENIRGLVMVSELLVYNER